MNKTNQTYLTAAIIVILIIGIVLFYEQVPEETIKIGAIFPLSGKASSLGDDIRNALDLALEKINKDHTVIELIYEDEKCDPKEAVTAYKTLVDLKKVKIIIGAGCSSSTLAMAPLAEQEKVFLITPASSSDKISQAGDFIFRNHVLVSQKLGKLGEFAGEKFETVATIYDQSNDGFVLGEEAFVENFQPKTVPRREPFQSNAMDFKTELIKIKEQNPESIFIGALMPQAALIVKQKGELGIRGAILMDDATATDKEFLDAIGDLSNGILFSGSDFSRKTNPEFWDLYTERFNKNPNIFAAQAYDCLMIVYNIIQQKCKRGNSVCIKNQFYEIQDYSGVSGKISFDENGDAIKPIVIKTIKNGTFVPYEEE